MVTTVKTKFSKLRARLPDLEEQREDRWLLVWKDPPNWMVVDTEFREFLRALDGSQTWDEIFTRHFDWSGSERRLSDQLPSLEARGILQSDRTDAIAKTSPALPRAAIESITVNMTRQCNLRCHYCYLLPELGKARGNEVSTEEVVRFLDKIKPSVSKRPLLALLGGEPLLEPGKVIALAAYAKRHGWECLVSTNGHRVTPGFAREACRQRLQVQVSLDGPDAERHDALRGVGSFVKALAGVRELTRARVHVILSLIAHSGNLDCLEDYYRFAMELGVREARFIPLKRIGGAQSGGLKPVSLATLMGHAADVFARHPEFRRLAGRDAFSVLAGTCRLSVRRPSCGTGLQTFLLDADGAIYPCVNLIAPEFHVANIRDPQFDFEQIWEASPVLERVRRATCVEWTGNACAECAIRTWCLGGCHGESWSLCNELNSSAWDCADQRKAITDMIWLLADTEANVPDGKRLC